MKPFYKTIVLLITANLLHTVATMAQATKVSTCGFTVSACVKPTQVVPATLSCPYGYNFNVRFDYVIKVSGVNTCYDGSIQLDPLVNCSGIVNQYNSIILAAPTVGASASSVTYTGTATTGTGLYSTLTNCATVTVASYACNTVNVRMNGPGMPSSTMSGGACMTLPIELLSFDVQCAGNTPLFNWSTATEVNNNYFTIESSTNLLHWKTIATIDGAGNSATLKKYSYNYTTPSTDSLNYYRLKQTDYDGAFTFSEIITVRNCIIVKTNEISVYPNPTKSLVTIELPTNETISYQVVNNLGQVIVENKMNNQTIDLSTYPNGIYTLRVISSAGVSTQRIVKQ